MFVFNLLVISPLGPALANIFVGYCEEKLFSQMQKPPTYFRFVDDTFAIFDHETETDELLSKLNCLQPSLKFIFEKEKDKGLPFFDVCVERTDIGFETSVYRKPTSPANIYVGSPLVFSNVK